jgi:diaminopimelate epimerase
MGIGADGLIIVAPPAEGVAADGAMLIINADGSPGGMCGNGMRCATKVLCDHGHAASDQHGRIFIHLGGRTHSVTVFRDDDGRVETVCTDLGKPMLELEHIPVDPERLEAHPEPHTHCIDEYPLVFVSMGNPHAVLFTSEAESLLFSLGPTLERHPAFPERINVHFVQVNDSQSATVLSWERGVGHTLACGSGVCAVTVAGHLTGRLARDPVMHVPGGDLITRWDAGNDHVYLTGPVRRVYEGTIDV